MKTRQLLVKFKSGLSWSAVLFVLLPIAAFGQTVSLEAGTDRMGGDYKSFALAGPQPELCRQACANDAACKAYTYVKPGVQGRQAMCFLKSSVPPSTPNECCTSGARAAGGRPEPIVIRPGPPPRPAPPIVGGRPTPQNPNLPDKLTLLSATGAAGSSVILQNVRYSNPNGSAGRGDLIITLAGRPPVTLPVSPFEGISQRNGRITTGWITLTTDLIYEDLFGSGVDLILEKGGQFLVRGSTRFAGGIRMRLPYFSASGERAEIQLAQTVRHADGPRTVISASFELESNGACSISQQNVRLSKPAINTASDGLKIAGITIKPNDLTINFTHPGTGGKPFDFLITTGARLATYVPNLLTQGDAPLGLSTDNLILNEEGIVSFDARLAFSGGFHFAQPMDFAMILSADPSHQGVVAASYSKDHYTKFFIEGDLVLPSSVRDLSSQVDPQFNPQQRAVLRGVKMSLNNQKWAVEPGGEGSISFGAGYKLAIGSYSIDLSPAGGIRVKAGNLSGGIIAAGTTVQLSGDDDNDDLFIDTFGVTGSVLFPETLGIGPKVGDFSVIVKPNPKSKLEFKQNAQVGTHSFPGEVLLNDNSFGNMGSLPVWVDLPAGGAPPIIKLDPDKPLKTLTLNKFNVSISVSSVTLDDDNNLWLTGALTFKPQDFDEALPSGSVALPFTNVGLAKNKGFTPGMISLDGPVALNVGLFSVNVEQFNLPSSSLMEINLSGGVQLSSDLPLTGAMNLTGLRINSVGSLEFGKISFTDLGLMDVATISGTLAKTKKTVGGEEKDYLYGDITKFKLNFAGEMPSAQLHFLVGNGSWLVLGSVNLPPGTSIPLGSSGFALYGFRGGLGHNVKLNQPIGPNFNATELSSTDFSPIQDGSWLFQAGVRVGTTDAFLLWGDATLTVTTQPLLINLNLAANLLEQMPTDPNQSPSGDRTALGNMTYDNVNSSFQTTLQVDLAFPTRKLSVANATGSADLLFSPSDSYVRIGWPPLAPVSVKILGRDGQQGGLAFGDLDALTPRRKGFGATFVWGADFGFINGQIDGTLLADLTNIKTGNFTVVGVLHASGSVDFYLFDASIEAMLQAQLQSSGQLQLTGELRGCVGMKFIGHVCESIGPETWTIGK